jgi:hypothetical protein
MFKHAFYLLQEHTTEDVLCDLFWNAESDEVLIARLRNKVSALLSESGKKQNVELHAAKFLLERVFGEERTLYKAVLEKNKKKDADYAYGSTYYNLQRNKAKDIFEVLVETGVIDKDVNKLGEHNILIDSRGDNSADFGDIRVDIGGGETERLGTLVPVVDQIDRDFVELACKLRVFVNPEVLMPKFRGKDMRHKIEETIEKHIGAKI